MPFSDRFVSNSHLYAGAGLVVCWAAAVACVPFMQKGNDTARSLHIACNIGGLALFGWQVTSGIPILLKVIEKTQWSEEQFGK